MGSVFAEGFFQSLRRRRPAGGLAGVKGALSGWRPGDARPDGMSLRGNGGGLRASGWWNCLLQK